MHLNALLSWCLSRLVLGSEAASRHEEASMSTATIGAIIAAVALVAALAFATGPVARRRRLRRRFGPEYERIVSQRENRREAETELAGRERRVRDLQLRDLTDAERDRYEAGWDKVQERFVDAPTEAIGAAQRLVEAVMRERGYPVAEYEQMVVDLSVQHARTLEHFRSAHDVIVKSGEATTEELRAAMLQYRELFSGLIGRSIGPDADKRSRDGRALLRIK
jgi:hypothetical protein